MNVYRIGSPAGDRAVEAWQQADGDIFVRLVGEDGDAPFFSGALSRMAVCSTGRPWRENRMRLSSAMIAQEGGALRFEAGGSALDLTLKLVFDTEGLLRVESVWANRSGETVRDAAVGLEWELDTAGTDNVTIPHMIYNNNPSADPARLVPRLGEGEGKGFICEEHRLPIPCVNVEWREREGGQRYFSLFSLPAYLELPDGTVHYGSLGAYRREGRVAAAAMSGVLMFNGEKDVVYVSKSQTAPYAGGYTDFPPGFALAKSYALEWGRQAKPGRAFARAVHTAVRLYDPKGADPLPLGELIRLKTAALDDRWRETDRSAGYVKFNDRNSFGLASGHGLQYMYGWTGQCLKLAWCDAFLGFDGGQAERIERCRKAVDFYIAESGTAVPGLRNAAYRLADGRWDHFRWLQEPVVSSRAFGETVADLADIILLFRDRGADVPARWTAALEESASFLLNALLSSGIFPPAWRLDGSPADETITAAGVPCLIALIKAYEATGRQTYLDVSRSCMERYYELHARTFERPFARSTLDARCEDKEAGMFFFLAAYELFRLTGEPAFREWAEIAADWQLTFVFMWNPVYDKGTVFREQIFRAVGWPGVSVQNHHLDVFFPTYELWRFGRATGNETYVRLARTIFGALGQGICSKPGEWGFTVVGEQAEGFFQSNFQGRGRSNTWNPSWVISEVLHHALRFRRDFGTAWELSSERPERRSGGESRCAK